MRGADGVHTHLLEDEHLALDCVARGDRTEGTLIVVHAHTLKLDALTVEQEAVGVVGGVAVAEGGVVGVDDLTVNRDLGARGVERGVVREVPELVAGDGSVGLDGLGGVGLNGRRSGDGAPEW